jgi:hypothetical protein
MQVVISYNGGRSWECVPSENDEEGLHVYLLNMQDHGFSFKTVVALNDLLSLKAVSVYEQPYNGTRVVSQLWILPDFS